MHVAASHDHRSALQFEPRNPVCLNAFRECLQALLAQSGEMVPETERIRAQHELQELLSLGRLSPGGEEGLGGAGGPMSSPVSASAAAVASTAGGALEKKKRGAGGL